MVFSVDVTPFGNGKLVWLRTDALRVGLANFGATITSVKVFKPKDNTWTEVNCGYASSPAEAEADTDYMGVTVGRCAGRVSYAHFSLDGTEYLTDKNMDGKHTCHSGFNAFHKKHWGYTLVSNESSIGVRFEYVSPHMENGFPAELLSTVYYHIESTSPNVLRTDYHAHITDTSPADATAVNLFNHAYWNLNGVPERDGDAAKPWQQPEPVLNHMVRVPAGRVVEADRCVTPTGKLLDITGTSLDFRNGRVLKNGYDDAKLLNRDPSGYDHPLVIDNWSRGKTQLNAEAVSPLTNIKMTVYSSYPCMWVYSGNNKPLPASGKVGQRYARWTGLGLEPQHYPNAVNQPAFPSLIIRRGQSTFEEKMINEFTIVEDAKL